MEDILAWGLDLVRWAQEAASPALTLAMNVLSFMGSQWCLMAILVFIYWCVDKERGLRMCLLVGLSGAINSVMKLAFAQPRPYDLDRSVGLAFEPTFGFPSGHAQNTVVLWGTAIPLWKKRLGLALALALPFAVGLSRIYLGVHFPTDVFGGWAIGALFLAVDFLAWDRVIAILAKTRDSMKLALVAAISFGLNAVGMNDTSLSGIFFGLGAAIIYAPRIAPFSVEGRLGKRVLRFLIGAASVATIYLAPKLLLAGIEPLSPALIRFVRYALVSAWAVAGAPWLFLRLKLAECEAKPGPSYSA